jgi:putative salt-induced outer membrane protein YdiY
MMSLKWSQIVWGVGLIVAWCCSIAYAEEPTPPEPPPPPPPPWSGSVNFGLNASSGNTHAVSGSFATDATYKQAPSEFHTEAMVSYGKTDGTVSPSKAMGMAQYNYFFTDRFSAFLTGGAEHDGVADLNWRVSIGPGGSYYFIKGEQLSLSGEMGISYVSEQFSSQAPDAYGTLRIAELGEWKFSEKSRVWEKAAYYPALNGFFEGKKYLVKAEAGLEALITAKAVMRFIIQDSYDNNPAPGRRPNDTTYLALVGYKF